MFLINLFSICLFLFGISLYSFGKYKLSQDLNLPPRQVLVKLARFRSMKEWGGLLFILSIILIIASYFLF